ncbi:MAG: 16S rRNA (adenine(1518)-N(6)/adenine(1519)-N(6))-dimethyltransferase RsmA [Ruminococcus sp.]|nr:16S rRNA (adenine(1518)-N(6)/adenine(1519)-N(6))-dimethyltransferase RsmA [Ruminococcus sp.]
MENLYDLKVISDILTRHSFATSKKLGQNFITNPSICPKIAELGGAQSGVGIIEIGTGLGVLTHELAKRADKVCAVELDSRLMPILDETLSEHTNVKIINDDILKINLKKLIQEEFSGLKVAVCANLPYYITSPVIMRLLEERLDIESVTVMVQKEAGVRLCAKTGTRECSAVTYAVRYFSKPKLLFNVSRGSFYPTPNVDSCVICFDILKEPPCEVTDEKFFFSMIRGAFNQRRKTLCNSLNSALGIDKATVSEALNLTELPPTVRPEAVTLEQMAALSNELFKSKSM